MLFLFIMLSCTHKGFGLMSGARSLWFCNCCTCLFKVYRPRDAKSSDCKGYTGPEICWGNRMSKSDMAHSLQTWCSLLEENVPHNCPSPLNISLSLNELVWLCRVHVAEVETVQCAYIWDSGRAVFRVLLNLFSPVSRRLPKLQRSRFQLGDWIQLKLGIVIRDLEGTSGLAAVFLLCFCCFHLAGKILVSSASHLCLHRCSEVSRQQRLPDTTAYCPDNLREKRKLTLAMLSFWPLDACCCVQKVSGSSLWCPFLTGTDITIPLVGKFYKVLGVSGGPA